MGLYPLPAIVSLAMWLSIFFAAPVAGMIFAAAFLGAGVAAYLVFAKTRST
jgi:hypothetical protein